jgi:hypothetical protein
LKYVHLSKIQTVLVPCPDLANASKNILSIEHVKLQVSCVSNITTRRISMILVNIYYQWFALQEWISQSNITSGAKPRTWYAKRSPFKAKHLNDIYTLYCFGTTVCIMLSQLFNCITMRHIGLKSDLVYTTDETWYK